jgi:sugar lactone lactonase YvrE
VRRPWIVPLVCLATFVGWSVDVARAQPYVIVSSDVTDSVPMYDLSGNFVRNLVEPGGGGLDSPQGIAVGPDGNVYVSSAVNDRVLRYAPDGTPLGAIIDPGRLDRPWYLTFGPDGNLYVSSSATNRVLCYHGTTGAFLRMAAFGGGLAAPDGLSFDADGNMLVSQFVNTDSRVKKYNPQTGAFIEDVVDDSGLVGALEHRLSPDGTELFVSSFGTNSIRKYSVETGAFLGDFATGPLRGPVGQLVMPDGTLLVSSWNNSQIYRLDLQSGALIGTFASGGAGTVLDHPNNMAILVPEPGTVAIVACAAMALVRNRRSRILTLTDRSEECGDLRAHRPVACRPRLLRLPLPF